MERKDNKSKDSFFKKIAYINSALFFAVLIFFAVLFFILPKKEKSEEEKREFTKISPITSETVFSGKTAKELTNYVSDHFPFRTFFINFADELADLRGFKPDNVKIHGSVPPSSEIPEDFFEESSQNSEESSESSSQGEISESEAADSSDTSSEASETPSSKEESSSQSSSKDDETAVGEQQGSTFIYKDRAMGMFGCNPNMADYYTSAINNYAEVLGDDVQVYNVVVPTSIDFYIPQKYKSITQPQKPAIDRIYEKLSDKVISVDAYSSLEQHKDEYIYFRSDHHWTGLGAYYAYCEFAKAAGFEPVAMENFETRRLEGFLGTLYNQTKEPKLKENPDYVDYYMIDTPHQAYRYIKDQPFTPYPCSIHGEYARSPNSYSVFLHGDFPLVRIDTDIKNGKKIAVVKESYGNAFAPFLANHYEQVFVVDERYFQLGFIDFIKANGINELVFINNSMAAYTPYHIKNIQRIMYQQFTPPAPEPVEETPSSEENSSSEESSSENSEVNDESSSESSSSDNTETSDE